MRTTLICSALFVASFVAWAGPIPEKYRGDWLLVNGVVVLHLDEDGSMMLRNSGSKGPISIKDNGDFSWNLADRPQSGRLSEGRLFLKNDQAGAPKWMEYLEFRRASKEVANEVIEFALQQQTQAASAFERVRRSSVEKAILNNLRQLAAASDQFFLENGVTRVRLDQIVGPDKYIKKLTPIDGEDYGKLDLAQGATPWKVTSGSGITVTFER